jgi:TPR repeat protein
VADILFALAAVACIGVSEVNAQSSPLMQEVAQLSSELLKKAEAGEVDSQFQIGFRYAHGTGVPKNLGTAAHWYRKAAERGDMRAQYFLGVLLHEGTGVVKNLAEAYEWYGKSAEQGFSEAQYRVGFRYFISELPGDAVKAEEWLLRAAGQGHIHAQVGLGIMYRGGNGVPKDLVKSMDWFIKAAFQGDATAQFFVGMNFERGGFFTDAAEFYTMAAAQGDTDSQVQLGQIYAAGKGVPKDIVLAYAWLNLASSNGNAKAKDSLNLIESQLTSSERSEAQRLSSNWKNGQVLVRDGRPIAASAGITGAISKQRNGTIFVVSKTGHAITNQHVTTGCTELRIQGREGVAKLITEDAVNDLALIQIPAPVTATAVIASEPGKLRQGEDVVVFGFPLNSLLSSGGNLTPGAVSALTGLGNNTNQIQITAPIQPGSSGSPVFNRKGEVIGVVSMKLSDSKMVTATGSVGQNVNFAISGQTLKAFLDMHKVPYSTGSFFARDKSTADLADEARKWTLLVECWR